MLNYLCHVGFQNYRRCAWALALVVTQAVVRGQSDNFNTGTDTGWTRFGLSSAGLPPGKYSFPSDGQGGKAYRIQVAAPPVPDAGPAREFTYRKDVVYTNFFVAVDILGWDNSVNQAFGFLVRAGNIGLGQTTGYVMNYDPNQASGGRGQFQINQITDEAPTTIAAANVTLDPTRRYRFVMSGVGSSLVGQIYDYTDLSYPLVTISATDDTYPSGYLGLFNFSRVGSSQYTDAIAGKTDTTFDNYAAATGFPATLQGLQFLGLPGLPFLINRLPASNSNNLYAAAGGVQFTATTFTTNLVNPAAIQLWLNGADVSASLTFKTNATSAADLGSIRVSYSGLTTNTVYDAQIIATNSIGKITNAFTFDTFTDAYLASAAVKVIEVEDYNYESGKFQDNPPVSGIDANGAQVRGNGVGYLDLVGTPGIDYQTLATQLGGGLVADYRGSDTVGTGQGAAGLGNTAEIDGVDINDTTRQKYAADGLGEYEVRRTQGGDWLNYTRNFTSGKYNAYLRVGCRASQPIILSQVGGDPTTTNQTTTTLGTFMVPSTGMAVIFRYVPLVDSSGNPAVLNLAGTTTLRLTMGGASTNNAIQYTMYLNYLAFVPAAAAVAPDLTIESSANVNGPYTADSTAGAPDPTAQTITVSASGSVRFYRIRRSGQVFSNSLHIKGIKLNGGQVVVAYEYISL